MNYPRKLNVVGQVWWHHHRGAGGAWRRLTEAIRAGLSHPGGVTFFDDLGSVWRRPERFAGPWAAVWHLPVLPGRPGGLEARLREPFWAHVAPACRALFTLSPHTAGYLAAHTGLPVCGLLYPVDPPALTFSPARFRADPRPPLLMVGHSHRLVRPFHELPAPRFRKVHLRGAPPYFADEGAWADDGSVAVMPRVPDPEYDALLARSAVFLDYHDTAANTTVVECIARNTPLLIRRSPAAEDYLGPAYPLFFDTPGEAAARADDLELVLAASAYLGGLAIKPKLTVDHFLGSFVGSEAYLSLPTPC